MHVPWHLPSSVSLSISVRVQRKAAVYIQGTTRVHQARQQRQQLSEWQRSAKNIVLSFIRALDHEDKAALRALVTSDFDAKVDLPNLTVSTKGVNPFLEHELLSRRPPKVTKVLQPLKMLNQRHAADEPSADLERDVWQV